MRNSNKLLLHIWILMPLSTTYWGFCKFIHPETQNFCTNKYVSIISFFHPLLNLLLIDHDTRFRAVSYMDLGSGFLSLENFKTALSNIQRQPKLECIKGLKDLNTFSLIFMYCLCGTYSSKHLLLLFHFWSLCHYLLYSFY